MDWLFTLGLSAIVGYLLGAIPTGTLVGRSRGIDLTAVGSRRTGATNALRTLGPTAAILVLVGDFAKGAGAVLVARALADGAAWPQVFAATAAVIGHGYSPFIGFRGGRGVVTGMGGLALILPWVALVPLVFGAATVALTRYVSLGSIVGTVAAGLAVVGLVLFAGQPTAYLYYGLLVPLFILVSHRDNIQRLLDGTERKLGEKA